jgi:hypothetical protein
MVSAYDVAAALIDRAHRLHRSIDKKQLEKELYNVQGLHLALYGERAFTEGAFSPILRLPNGPLDGCAAPNDGYRARQLGGQRIGRRRGCPAPHSARAANYWWCLATKGACSIESTSAREH